jgi:hypothetical protein
MSDTPNSRNKTPSDFFVSGQDGRNPPPGNPPKEGFTRVNKGMRESTKYGILLFFLTNQFQWPLSNGQVLWIVYRSRKLSEAELLRSGRLSLELTNSEQARKRLDNQIRRLYYTVPALNPKLLPEKRTIGIGYRDKGSLRPLHEQRGKEGVSFWDEDIVYLLPLDYKIEGKWISAEEVISLVGVEPLILATLQVQNQTLTDFYPWNANHPDPFG